MSNPWAHRARRFDPERGQYVAVTGDSVADDVAVTWSAALAEAGHSLDEIDNCAARVRDGARAACKRLRGERDEARAWIRAFREWQDVAARTLETIPTLTAERDASRLELRALEWLVVHHPDELRALVLADGSGRYSYCARALGWEG